MKKIISLGFGSIITIAIAISIMSPVAKAQNAGTFSASIVDASSDKVGTNFGSGAGLINGNNPYDWHFQAVVILPTSKTASYIEFISNDGWQGFSTRSGANSSLSKGLYPLLVNEKASSFGLGTARISFTNTAYDQRIPMQAGINQFDLYGQPENPAGTTFPGGTLTVAFTDGTKLTTIVPASSVSIPQVNTPVSAAASAAVVGTPTLNLTYDSAHKESSLTANFSISINGGTTGTYVYTYPSAALYSGTNNAGMQTVQFIPTPTSTISTTVDSYGNSLFVIPAGQTIKFSYTGRANPQQLFAGTYYASIYSISATSDKIAEHAVSLVLPSNKSNSVTVIGETSPYISSASVSGNNMVVTGQRLNGGTINSDEKIYIDGQPQVVGIGTQAIDGSKLTFSLPIPVIFVTGQHSLQIVDSVGPNAGASNQIAFQVQSSGTTTTCYLFTMNQTIGTTGADVAALQIWLIAKGFAISDISSGASQPGYFGSSTAVALASYQTSVGLPSTGVVGPETRAVLNASCTTPVAVTQIVASLDPASPVTSSVQISTTDVTPNVPLAVFDLMSQNGPSTLNTFSPGVIVMNNGGKLSNFFTNLFVKIGGQMYAETSLASDGQTVSFGNLNVPMPANVQIPITIYGSVAASNVSGITSANASANLALTGIVAVDSSGNKVSVGQGTVAGLLSGSNLTFVSATSTSLPPVISGGTFPTQLNTGQTGTWSVKASDPQNGSLSYSVDWGDATSCPVGFTCAVSKIAPSPTQSSTFTHSYTAAGTYTVTFTVTNSAGLSAKTTSTVSVYDGIVSTPVTPVIINPISATTTNPSVPSNPPNSTQGTTSTPVIISTPVTPVVSTPTYSLTVTSPNGGENWKVGSTQRITWSSNIGASATVSIDLMDSSGGRVVSSIANVSNTGSYRWSVPFRNSFKSSGQYKIRITSSSVKGGVSDVSNNPFTINANLFGADGSDNAALTASIWDAVRAYFGEQ